MAEKGPPPDTVDAVELDRMGQAQLETYARELQELYQQERRLRRELEQEAQNLQKRVNELSALNKMFQDHLAQWSAADSAFSELAGAVDDLSQASSRFTAGIKSPTVDC